MTALTLEGIGTIFAMIAILSVFAWAYSGKRKARFDEAAMLPFADDDNDRAPQAVAGNDSTGKAQQ